MILDTAAKIRDFTRKWLDENEMSTIPNSERFELNLESAIDDHLPIELEPRVKIDGLARIVSIRIAKRTASSSAAIRLISVALDPPGV